MNLRVLLVLALAAASVTAAADDAATRQLVEQGRFWEEHDQPQRAIEAWQRVLSVDPKNAEALQRLSALKAGGGVSTSKSDALTRARTLAASKNYTGAIDAYQESFAGKPPDGPVAIEYYQTLGGTPNGWASARDGLAELELRHPGEPRYAFAYAQHLTYRENTRRDGIDRLAALDQAQVPQARAAWRQALIWLQAEPGDAERYARYQRTNGDDAEVQQRMQGLRSAGAARAAGAHAAVEGARIREIYTQIDANNLDGAQSSIDSLLASQPHNADAHGALGVLRLRQQRYAEAEQALTQAQTESPAQGHRFGDALRSAKFWRHIQAAQTARDAGDLESADREYTAAFANSPADTPDVLRVAHADVLLQRNRDHEAETIDREVLRRSPDNPDALRGLITVLTRSGREAEALKLSEGAPQQVQDQLAPVRANQLRARAAGERGRGELPQAQADLEQALLLDPASPWIRLDLASVYRAQGRTEQAQTMLQGLAISNGELPQVHMAQAYAAGEAGDWLQTLQILEQLPSAARDADATALQRRAWINYQLDRVKAAVALRQPAEGYAILDQSAEAAGNDPELLAAVAGGWAQVGDSARAVGTMRRAIERSPHAAPSMRVQYAALLLSAGQDGEFEVVADDIVSRGILTSKDQQTMDDLVVGYRVKLADRARTSGKLSEAYVQLRDVIARYPDDSRVQQALARLLVASGDLDQSAAIYQSQLKQAPADISSQLGLIDVRLAAGDREAARTLIKSGLRAHPDDPRYWQASARLAESENRRGDALSDYRRAQEVQGKLAAKSDLSQPPQLAWLDPTQPDRALPAAIAAALGEVAPSTGPLRPRASQVALPPIGDEQNRYAQPAVAPVTGDSSPQLRLAPGLGVGERSGWMSPAPAPALKPDARLTANEINPQAANGLDASPSLAPLPAVDSVSRLAAETSGWIGGAVTSRTRSGQAGLGQLEDLEAPVSWRSRETTLGRLGIDVTPVFLQSGNASGSDKLLYGSVALIAGANAATSTGTTIVQADAGDVALTTSAGGAALDLNYQYGPLTADIGTTPLGFLEQRLVGGIKLGFADGFWRFGIAGLRRAVTESLLSYAGEKDPLTGKNFGGVTRTGGHGDVTYDAGEFGLYANAGFYTLDGHNVDSNTEVTGGAGVYAKAIHTDAQELTYGLNLTTFSYDKNLRFFTFGQGGYFSPQLFLALTVPLEWTGRRGALTWKLNGALGVQSFREDGSGLFPGFAVLQDSLESLIGPSGSEPTLNLPSGYASQNSTGLAYAFSGAGEYRLLPRLSLGGQFGVDNARDYRELQINGYLRYYFDDQTPLVVAPPSPILPVYAQ